MSILSLTERSFNCFIVGWLLCILNISVTSNFRRTIARREGHRFISCRMIAETNSTAQETRTITYQEIMRSSTYVGKVGQIASFFSAANIILSIIAFLGNFLILVALNKESSLHSSSKLLYCYLATSRCVGWSCQPASLSCLLVVLGSREVEPLSIRN